MRRPQNNSNERSNERTACPRPGVACGIGAVRLRAGTRPDHIPAHPDPAQCGRNGHQAPGPDRFQDPLRDAAGVSIAAERREQDAAGAALRAGVQQVTGCTHRGAVRVGRSGPPRDERGARHRRRGAALELPGGAGSGLRGGAVPRAVARHRQRRSAGHRQVRVSAHGVRLARRAKVQVGDIPVRAAVLVHRRRRQPQRHQYHAAARRPALALASPLLHLRRAQPVHRLGTRRAYRLHARARGGPADDPQPGDLGAPGVGLAGDNLPGIYNWNFEVGFRYFLD